jgi:glycosyltransferase involved in cell wall biosynthesis
MSQLIKVNIGIPAFNEGANIQRLLLQVLEQEETDFSINKVIVISDGSSDNTVTEVQKISDPRVVLVNHSDRRGKAARFQELLQLSDTEILIQLDADIKLEDKYVVSKLVNSIKNGADLAFPKMVPLAPRTYIENVSFFGAFIWEKVLSQMPKELTILHRCQGRCRAFSKKFYKTFVLPIAADSVEDVYSFFFAITNGFKPAYVPDAQIRCRLPSTRKDYLKQMRRFVTSGEALSQFFAKDLTDKYSPTSRMKFVALVKGLFNFLPHISLGYIVLQFYARKTASMNNQKPIYEYVSSTKELQ